MTKLWLVRYSPTDIDPLDYHLFFQDPRKIKDLQEAHFDNFIQKRAKDKNLDDIELDEGEALELTCTLASIWEPA